MNISIKHNNNKDIIFYVKEAPPVPLLPTYPPCAESNAYHFAEKGSSPLPEFALCTSCFPFTKEDVFVLGLRFTNKSLGPSEKQSSQGERSIPPAPTCSSASGTCTHCCKLPLPAAVQCGLSSVPSDSCPAMRLFSPSSVVLWKIKEEEAIFSDLAPGSLCPKE